MQRRPDRPAERPVSGLGRVPRGGRMTTTLGRIAALAADRRVHRAFHWLHLHELQLRHWQLETIAIPAPPFAESARADWFLSRFHDLGLTNIHLDEAGNALATSTAGVPH